MVVGQLSFCTCKSKVMNILLLLSHYKLFVFRKKRNRCKSFHIYSHYFTGKGTSIVFCTRAQLCLRTVCTMFYYFIFFLTFFMILLFPDVSIPNIYQLSLKWSETTNELLHSSCVRLLPVFNQILICSCCVL